MRTIKNLTVADNTGELDSLNELEYINGYIFANVWYTNQIYKIDTANGHAVGVMDFTGLSANMLRMTRLEMRQY